MTESDVECRERSHKPVGDGEGVGRDCRDGSLVPFVRRVDQGPHPELLTALRSHLPEVDVVEHAEIPVGRLPEATVAIVDGPSADQLASLPNLALVQSTWAGVEAIIPAVPDGVAIARMVDPQLAATMAEAVLAWTLYLHRDMPRYARQQRAGEWIEHPAGPHVGSPSRHRRSRCARDGRSYALLADQGFDVAGWSRSTEDDRGRRAASTVTEGLAPLLGRSDIVVNLLPHTEATTGPARCRGIRRDAGRVHR